MPLTTAQIDEQMTLEKEAIAQGIKRLTDQTIKLENQSYASATIYGMSSIDTLIPHLIKRINETTLVCVHQAVAENRPITVCAFMSPIPALYRGAGIFC